MKNSLIFIVSAAIIVLLAASCKQPCSISDPVAGLYSKSIVVPNITYLNIDGTELQLDAYVPAINKGGPPWVEFTDQRKPVLLYIHGGGWTGLNRTIRNLNIMPYIEKGFAVVNIDYRLLDKAPLPACIADCRYALNWIYDNADKYKFDTTQIVVSGESAGGHLSLMTAFLPDDKLISIPGKPIHRKMKVAAVVNWFGVSDMNKIAAFWNSPDFTRLAVGDTTKTEQIFRISSPLTYINANVPPVLTIHGDADSTVPFIQATWLHDALTKAKVRNELHVIKGKKHGDFDEKEMAENFSVIWKFLKEAGIKGI